MVIRKQIGFRAGEAHVLPLHTEEEGHCCDKKQDQNPISEDDPGSLCPKALCKFRNHIFLIRAAKVENGGQCS